MPPGGLTKRHHTPGLHVSYAQTVRTVALAVLFSGIATAAQVAFAGCAADGQAGPQAAPSGASVPLSIPSRVAAELTYYRSPQLGVLGPRGWHCFEIYGSGGVTLWVTPEPIDRTRIFLHEDYPLFTGPVIQLRQNHGQTSGRFRVAEVVVRVFPAHVRFVREVQALYESSGSGYTFGPYTTDLLTYKNREVVEYTTPANKDGLGTDYCVMKNDASIRGVAVLTLPDYELFHLQVRLGRAMDALVPFIVRQAERDLSRMGR